jgi:hypothetical protein
LARERRTSRLPANDVHYGVDLQLVENVEDYRQQQRRKRSRRRERKSTGGGDDGHGNPLHHYPRQDDPGYRNLDSDDLSDDRSKPEEYNGYTLVYKAIGPAYSARHRFQRYKLPSFLLFSFFFSL